MNPYAKILRLLEALPYEERLLVSLKRRAPVGEKECGCLFGTLLTKSGLPQTDGDPSTSFRCEAGTARPNSDISRWGRDTLALDGDDLYYVVRKLELTNDYYEAGNNNPETCRERYRHICARLRRLSSAYEEADERSPK